MYLRYDKSCIPHKNHNSQHAQKSCKYQRPWPPPMPHMNTFPWSYGHDIISTERKLPLLHSDTIVVLLIWLVLRPRSTYATTHIATVFRQPCPHRRRPMHLLLPSPGHRTTPFGGESSIIHMDMGRLCWIWLILGWRYHYNDIYLTRASTKYQR